MMRGLTLWVTLVLVLANSHAVHLRDQKRAQEYTPPAVIYGSKSVYALNVSPGTVIWRYPTGGPVESSPAVSNGVVYVGSADYSSMH